MTKAVKGTMTGTFAPKKLDASALQTLSIPMLVAHLALHERYARMKLRTEAEYNRYHADYLQSIYDIGNRKDTENFALEIAIARIEAIPFSHAKKAKK